MQGSAQTSPSQDRQIFLYRTGPAAFDISVVSPLNSNVLSAVGARAGAASEVAELRKHTANNAKCAVVLGPITPVVSIVTKVKKCHMSQGVYISFNRLI